MSAPINDGGLAFPYRETENTGQFQHHYGMTLRDYFAGQALSADYMGDYAPAEQGRVAYEVADAMLAAREGKQ
jgi:hypothetical protein